MILSSTLSKIKNQELGSPYRAKINYSFLAKTFSVSLIHSKLEKVKLPSYISIGVSISDTLLKNG